MNLKHWFASGSPYIWLNAGAVSISLIMVIGIILMIAVRGLDHFWPDRMVAFDYLAENGQSAPMLGIKIDEELGHAADAQSPFARWLIKIGNRDLNGLDFLWVKGSNMGSLDYPPDAMVIERREWGNAHGFLTGLILDGEPLESDDPWRDLAISLAENAAIFATIEQIEKNDIGAINYQMEKLRLKQRKLQHERNNSLSAQQQIAADQDQFSVDYKQLTDKLDALYQELNRKAMVMETADGTEVILPLAKVVRVYRPNRMHLWDKVQFYFAKLWEFFSADPREANTEGGIFPAIFGTIMMVFIMAVFVTPFGVMAAVYLHEYANQGVVTRLMRIAVNNLAGVPSIVYGVFGLGFFVYFLGGHIDQLFFAAALPNPTFGTPGILWASLTLALLTMPVVIVATEEGLSRVPKAIREGSLALGATRAETLWLTVLPMTAPAMMTGLILAVARAAGEVAPLMLVGVVKLAPSLPVDGNSPFIHLNRKFMHLGFHIYDVGFQSPNVEAARPLVYATALLLIVVIIVLNMAAFKIRNNLREKYRAAEQ